MKDLPCPKHRWALSQYVCPCSMDSSIFPTTVLQTWHLSNSTEAAKPREQNKARTIRTFIFKLWRIKTEVGLPTNLLLCENFITTRFAQTKKDHVIPITCTIKLLCTIKIVDWVWNLLSTTCSSYDALWVNLQLSLMPWQNIFLRNIVLIVPPPKKKKILMVYRLTHLFDVYYTICQKLFIMSCKCELRTYYTYTLEIVLIWADKCNTLGKYITVS